MSQPFDAARYAQIASYKIYLQRPELTTTGFGKDSLLPFVRLFGEYSLPERGGIDTWSSLASQPSQKGVMMQAAQQVDE